jgi:hypothetical protein
MLSHHVPALFFASWIIVSDHNKRCRAESAQILGQQHSLGTALYAFLSEKVTEIWLCCNFLYSISATSGSHKSLRVFSLSIWKCGCHFWIPVATGIVLGIDWKRWWCFGLLEHAIINDDESPLLWGAIIEVDYQNFSTFPKG